MCGDFDDSESIDNDLFERFVELAAHYGAAPQISESNAPRKLMDEHVRKKYADELFRAGLVRSLNDAAALPHGERMDAIAGQAIVFARLAGFLAAQFPPQADLFRMITSAMLDGHKQSTVSR